MKLPLISHRWLSRGAGWSYHPSLESAFQQLTLALKSELANRTPGEFVVITPDKTLLLGIRVPDDNCPDPHAKSRKPYILVAAVSESPLAEKERDAVLAAIRELPLPEDHGPSEAMLLNTDRNTLVVTPPDQHSWYKRLWMSDVERLEHAVLWLEHEFKMAVRERDSRRLTSMAADTFCYTSCGEWHKWRGDKIEFNTLLRHCISDDTDNRKFEITYHQGIVVVTESVPQKRITRVYRSFGSHHLKTFLISSIVHE